MEGHGDHWGCFGDVSRALAELLPVAIAHSDGDIFVDKDFQVPHPQTGEPAKVFSLANPGTDLRPLALLGSGPDSNEVWSAYPFAKRGTRHRLVIDDIEVWGNGIEARIQATFADAAPVGFFDTLFHVNSCSYEVGKEYTFSLAGVAYSVEVIKPDPIRITDPEAVERQRQIWEHVGQELALTEDGAVEFRLEGAAILLPIEGWDIDEYQFHGPVREVSSFRLERWTIHAIRVPVMVVDDQDFDIILYVADTCLKGPPPRPGDDIRGTMWLQGYLAEGGNGGR